MHSMPIFAVLEVESRHESSAKQQQAAMFAEDLQPFRYLLFHLVQRISLHFKSPDLYLFCTTKVFRFRSYDYAPRSLSMVRAFCQVSGRACSCKKDPCSLPHSTKHNSLYHTKAEFNNCVTSLFLVSFTFRKCVSRLFLVLLQT